MLLLWLHKFNVWYSGCPCPALITTMHYHILLHFHAASQTMCIFSFQVNFLGGYYTCEYCIFVANRFKPILTNDLKTRTREWNFRMVFHHLLVLLSDLPSWNRGNAPCLNFASKLLKLYVALSEPIAPSCPQVSINHYIWLWNLHRNDIKTYTTCFLWL